VNGGSPVADARRRWRIVDAALVIGLAAIIESLVWSGTGPGDPITGSKPLTSLLPLLLALPLWWRRRYPLAVCVAVMSGMVSQALISGHAAEGLEAVIAAGAAAYSVGATGNRRHALAGIGVIGVGYAAWVSLDRNVRSGRSSELWAAAFFALYLLAAWLVGVVLQARRDSAVAAGRAAAVEREAARAVDEERARIARDLHDIVSHNLSVVVVQAAGGRARGERTPEETAATLEKIESSGRQALAEMRRLLGVLRTPGDAADDPATLAPPPGIDHLGSLVGGVRDAGVDVRLSVDTSGQGVSPAVDVSVYRIVQEALTNVLKHAGPGASAQVAVSRGDHEVTVTVVDDGWGPRTDPGLGHGLRGIRERVALLGGDLVAGGLPGGGFALRASLPAQEPM
jgi:signal transduction histidine kinase